MQELIENFWSKINHGFYLEFMINHGLSLRVLKYFNPAETDMKDFGDMMDFYIRKMLEENPEERMRVAQDIIELIEEYSNLSLN